MQIGPEAYRPDVAGAGFARGPGLPPGSGEHRPVVGQPQMHGSGMPEGGAPLSHPERRAGIVPAAALGHVAVVPTAAELLDAAARGAPVSFGITGDGMRSSREGTLYEAARFGSQEPVAHLDDLACSPGAAETGSSGGVHVETIGNGDGMFTLPTFFAGYEEDPLPDLTAHDDPPDKYYAPLRHDDV